MIPSSALQLQKEIRILLYILICALIISGITAFPIESELRIADYLIALFNFDYPMAKWLRRVYIGIHETNMKHPFISYGTDWLAFAHLIFAILFVGPLKDPVRNIWVIEFGMVACIGALPLAIIAGSVREVPLFWRMIDCSFGIGGFFVLLACYKRIKKLELSRETI